MFLPEPLYHVLMDKTPKATLLDIATIATDLTTYTFSAMAIREVGSPGAMGAHENVLTNNPWVATRERAAIVAVFSGADAASTFSVTSASLGGVAGVEAIDRGGASSNFSSAIYIWNVNTLTGITNTDLAITWSEAIQRCAVSVWLVEGLRSFEAVATGSNFISAATTMTVDCTIADIECPIGGVLILGGLLNGTTNTVTVESTTDGTIIDEPFIFVEGLYRHHSAAFSYNSVPQAATLKSTLLTYSASIAAEAVAVFMA